MTTDITELVQRARINAECGEHLSPAETMELVEALESEKRICATWRKTAKSTGEKLEKAQTINAATENLVRCKGRYHSEPMPLYADPRPEPISAEPVAWLLSGGGAKNVVVFDSGNAYADPLREVTPLYRHAQPVPVAYSDFESFWSSYIHPLAQDDELKGFAWDIWCAAMLQAGNSPVIPGWIPVSERMPEDDDFVYIWPRPDFGVELHVGQYCECSPKGDGWYAQVYEQNYGIEWHPITVTHWMPLPAGPQEVKGE